MKIDEKQMTNYEKLRKLWKTNEKQRKSMKNQWKTMKNRWKAMKNWKITIFQGLLHREAYLTEA